jgi:PilZ domain-containing protein
MSETASDSIDPLKLRRAPRVAGPFDGRWVDLLTVPLRIHDLSIGGCLIQAYHEQAPGRRFTLEIELPDEGWIEIEAESIYVREGYGFAVRFVEMTDETRASLDRVIQRIDQQTRKTAAKP